MHTIAEIAKLPTHHPLLWEQELTKLVIEYLSHRREAGYSTSMLLNGLGLLYMSRESQSVNAKLKWARRIGGPLEAFTRPHPTKMVKWKDASGNKRRAIVWQYVSQEIKGG